MSHNHLDETFNRSTGKDFKESLDSIFVLRRALVQMRYFISIGFLLLGDGIQLLHLFAFEFIEMLVQFIAHSITDGLVGPFELINFLIDKARWLFDKVILKSIQCFSIVIEDLVEAKFSIISIEYTLLKRVWFGSSVL